MKAVKTYQHVNSETDSITFGISKMEDIYTKRNERIDEPHRHNYYMALIVKQAKGEHKIDFNSCELGNKQLFFVVPGQVHQVIGMKIYEKTLFVEQLNLVVILSVEISVFMSGYLTTRAETGIAQNVKTRTKNAGFWLVNMWFFG